ncbi:MAG: hypothetical protein JNL70_05740 [Saprospiraceae bacterium]|nr:hypothetical protein [Saprospiraceae bacterium]
MYIVLISLVWGLFAAMLFLNVYIRVKAFKYYRRLVEARVDFGTTHIFNREKLEKEVYPKYPQHRDDIDAFVGHIRKSLNIAIILMALITLFGGILMYFRNDFQ